MRSLELIGNIVAVENTKAVDKLIECGIMYKLGMFIDFDPDENKYQNIII